MRLNDPLTTSITFKDNDYPIDLAFDNVLDVLEILEDQALTLSIKIETIVEMFIGESDLDTLEQIDLWAYIRSEFVMLGEEDVIETDELGNPMPIRKKNKNMDLVHDAKYIYSSFRQIGINLFEEQGRLSWEEFQALLESLPEDSIMQRIIQIRTWQPKKGDSAEHKKSMRLMQKRYALPGTVREDEEEDG